MTVIIPRDRAEAAAPWGGYKLRSKREWADAKSVRPWISAADGAGGSVGEWVWLIRNG